MAFARVVAFEDVTAERIEQLRSQIASSDGPPGDVPANEILILHDPQAEKSLAILFFENEDDYKRGDAALDAMPSGETPGQRVSIDKYEVVIRRTSEVAST
jgi:hypothetical protein